MAVCTDNQSMTLCCANSKFLPQLQLIMLLLTQSADLCKCLPYYCTIMSSWREQTPPTFHCGAYVHMVPVVKRNGIREITALSWENGRIGLPDSGLKWYCRSHNKTPVPWFSQKKFSLSKDHFLAVWGIFFSEKIPHTTKKSPTPPKIDLLREKMSFERENFFWENHGSGVLLWVRQYVIVLS